MNHERMLKVAEVIEASPENFDMSTYGTIPAHKENGGNIGPMGTKLLVQADLYDCGTTACIAGWAAWLWSAEVNRSLSIDANAAKILDIPTEFANVLFCRFDLPTATAAADHLRELVRADLDRESP